MLGIIPESNCFHETLISTQFSIARRFRPRGAKLSKKMPEVRVFGKWPVDEIEVQDPGLQSYVSVRPALVPHTGGRHEHARFRKSAINIVERLVNNMMRHGRVGGKKAKAVSIVKNAFEIIHLRTGKNPVEVFVRAIENTSPAEDVTRIAYGGIVYPISIDISPQRRIDISLRFMSEGARNSAYSNPRTVDECLAEEIMLAAQRDNRSHAVRKRDEMERVALASR
jgi:small subunit ribosomal protein S7